MTKTKFKKTKKLVSKKIKKQLVTKNKQLKTKKISSKKSLLKTKKEKNIITNNIDLEKQNIIDDIISTKSFETAVNATFFSTLDNFFDTLDYNDILDYIIQTYPALNPTNSDIVIKKTLLTMLEDTNFITNILTIYNITIFELFTIIYKNYSQIFKKQFIKKLNVILKNKKYVSIKQH